MTSAPSDQEPSIPSGMTNHYAAVGSVAGHWAMMELYIDLFAIELAQCDEKAGLCLTTQIGGSGRKLDAYIALAKLRGCKTAPATFDQLAKDTKGLAEQRNRVVHDLWIFEDQVPQRLETSAQKKLRAELIPMPTKDVLALNQNIRALIRRFIALHEQVAMEIAATSPETPQ